MKRIFLLIAGICSISIVLAQSAINVVVSSGIKGVATGAVQTTVSNISGVPSFTNNGTITDNAGTFNDLCGLIFTGSGITSLYNLNANHSGTTLFSSLVSVYNTTTLLAGSMNANNDLYVRSDAGPATMVNNGVLTNNVQGLITIASVTSGACPSYPANLSLNISGTEMVYQWQSSPDNVVWSNVVGANSATYTATVVATVYYRCNLTTINTAYAESTEAVRLTLGGPPGAITGNPSVCIGSATTLSDAALSGTWSSSNSNTATVDLNTGVVTGALQGITTISFANACGSTNMTATVNAVPAVIGGNAQMCTGGSMISLTNTATNGLWSGGTAGIATVDAVTGTVTPGSTQGTTTISYANGCGSAASITATVNATPAVIGGNAQMCAGGSTITLTNTSANGTWSSATTSIATVSVASGLVTPGVFQGTTTISYSNGCGSANVTATVNATPAAIGGNAQMCSGGSAITLTNTSANGTWSGGTTAVATVGATTGVVTPGGTHGTAVIIYSNGCGSASVTATVTATPVAIAGNTALCTSGSSVFLSDGSAGGTWSSSNPGKATVNTNTGELFPVTAGNSTITYSNGAGAGCSTSITASVTATPGPITGILNVCTGSAITLSNGVAGGAWSSVSTAIAVIGTGTGIVTGTSGGTDVISYSVGVCATTATITVNTVSAITGNTSICAGTATLSDATIGGVWASGNTLIATVGAASGIVTGVSPGSTLINYTSGNGCVAVTTFNFGSLSEITGIGNICIGLTTALSDATIGGTWSSSSTGIATVDLISGVVSGVAVGSANITYTFGSGCFTVAPVTVISSPAGITGTVTIMANSTTTLSDVTTGGAWSAANPGVAPIDPVTRIVSGITAGQSVISYTLGTCAVTTTVTVYAPVLCVGTTIQLSDAVAGGTWSSGNTAIATVAVATGLVTGVSANTVSIFYNLPGSVVHTKVVTVNPLAVIAPATSSVCQGSTLIVTNSSGAGTWSSSNPAIATVNSTGMPGGTGPGIVGGASPGQADIIFLTVKGCMTAKTITVNPTAAITGTLKVCASLTTILNDGVAGGVWSSSNTFMATVNPASGIVTGVASGSPTISYTLSTGCMVSAAITVNPLSVTSGLTAVCQGSTITLTNPTTGGGTWSSNNNAVATAGLTTGVVGGVSGGASIISFTTPAGCVATRAVTVNPVAAITGTMDVCQGLATTLSNSILGGVWSSSNTFVATITGATGVITGVASGSATIIYTTAAGCPKSSVITIHELDRTSGLSTVCKGLSIFLTNTTPGGGTWSSSNNLIATVNLTTGAVKGVGAGTANILFTSTVGGCIKSFPVTVTLCRIMDTTVVSSVNSTAATVSDIRIFPNPNNGAFIIKGSLGITEDEEVTIEMTDMLGQVIYKNKVITHNGNINESVQLSHSIANSTYLLNVHSGKENKMFHVIVEQ